MSTQVAKPKTGWVYIKKNKKTSQDTGHWSEKKKMEVVTTYLACGNLAMTARLCNIPEDTCRRWKTTDWWKDLTTTVREEEDIALDKKLSKILEASIEQVNDRITSGDYIFDSRTGKLKRVPVKLRDLQRVSAEMIDRRALLRKQPTQAQQSQENVADRLAKLADAFSQFAKKVLPEEKVVNEIVEGEFTELPPEYRDVLEPAVESGSGNISGDESCGKAD